MAFDAHKNFAVSTVVTPPEPALLGDTIAVAPGHGARFPAPPFNVVISPSGVEPTPANAEVARVTAKNVDVFTIARSQEDSAARSIITGDRITLAITAKTLTDIEEATAGGNGGSQPLKIVTVEVGFADFVVDAGDGLAPIYVLQPTEQLLFAGARVTESFNDSIGAGQFFFIVDAGSNQNIALRSADVSSQVQSPTVGLVNIAGEWLDSAFAVNAPVMPESAAVPLFLDLPMAGDGDAGAVTVWLYIGTP